jgi:hypothetical protein
MEESFLLPLMTYGPLVLQPTHGLSNLGLSALAVYRTRNTTRHAETPQFILTHSHEENFSVGTLSLPPTRTKKTFRLLTYIS